MFGIDLDWIAKLLGVIISFSAVIGLLTTWMKKKLSTATKESIKAEMAEQHKSFDEKFETLEGKIAELNKQMTEFAEREETTNDMLKKSLLASSRDRINQAHALYMKQQYIGAHSRFVLDELYESYKQLGGNSFIDQQMKDIHKLRVIDAETIASTVEPEE